MEDIRKYIDNSLFIKWVYQPDKHINDYWDFYLDKHPDEKKILFELKGELALFRISGQTLSEEKKKMLSEKIARKIQARQRRTRVSEIGRSFLKYAALALLIFGLGGGLVHYFNKKKPEKSDFARYFEMPEMPEMAGKPTLVLSDGSNINMNKNESTVDYASLDRIVVNNDSIIPVKKGVKKVEVLPNQYCIPYGSRGKLVLSDHTVVWLNAGSRLIYPSEFTGDEREVILFGEAFFEVAKDKSKPFIVKTSDYRIKVLGTRFNVSAYLGDDVSQTVLTEGSIELNMNNKGLFGHGVMLKPNELFSLNKGMNETKIQKVDPAKYVLWKDGIIKFENEDLSRVLKKIERYYDIQISLKNPLDSSILINGKLDLKDDKNEVVYYVSKVAKRKYVKLNERSYTIE
jgi:hypothetical protein